MPTLCASSTFSMHSRIHKRPGDARYIWMISQKIKSALPGEHIREGRRRKKQKANRPIDN